MEVIKTVYVRAFSKVAYIRGDTGSNLLITPLWYTFTLHGSQLRGVYRLHEFARGWVNYFGTSYISWRPTPIIDIFVRSEFPR